jgi:hypothetical protein
VCSTRARDWSSIVRASSVPPSPTHMQLAVKPRRPCNPAQQKEQA